MSEREYTEQETAAALLEFIKEKGEYTDFLHWHRTQHDRQVVDFADAMRAKFGEDIFSKLHAELCKGLHAGAALRNVLGLEEKKGNQS